MTTTLICRSLQDGIDRAGPPRLAVRRGSPASSRARRLGRIGRRYAAGGCPFVALLRRWLPSLCCLRSLCRCRPQPPRRWRPTRRAAAGPPPRILRSARRRFASSGGAVTAAPARQAAFDSAGAREAEASLQAAQAPATRISRPDEAQPAPDTSARLGPPGAGPATAAGPADRGMCRRRRGPNRIESPGGPGGDAVPRQPGEDAARGGSARRQRRAGRGRAGARERHDRAALLLSCLGRRTKLRSEDQGGRIPGRLPRREHRLGRRLTRHAARGSSAAG